MIYSSLVTSLRSFTTPTTRRATQENEEKPIASFRLSVLFRQNASWQGNIQWMEDKKVIPFRSVLELIQLIDTGLAAFDTRDDKTSKK